MYPGHNILSDSLRDRLKTLCAPFHDELEANSLAKELALGSVSKERYISYLQHMYLLHEKIESVTNSFEEFKQYNIETKSRTRLHLIYSDLINLGSKPIQKTNPPLSSSLTFPAAVGALYVLEGSTMGGRLLCERLKEMQGDNAQAATLYFQAYQEETLTLWREYCIFLNLYGERNPQDISEVILGACSTFLQVQEVMHAIR